MHVRAQPPMITTYLAGEDSVLPVLRLVLGNFFSDQHENFGPNVRSPIGLFKFQIALAITYLVVVWWELGFVVGFSISVIPALNIVGVRQTESYSHSLDSTNTTVPGKMNHRSYPLRVQFTPNLHGLVHGIPRGQISAF
jgi:hypothetical protein